MWKKYIAVPQLPKMAPSGATILCVTAGVSVGILAGPAVLGAVGFTSAGISAGSTGAYLMSLYGGLTPAGGAVATMQAAGAVGSVLGSPVMTGIAATTGAAVGAAVKSIWRKIR